MPSLNGTATFWEGLIERHNLTMHNPEDATRSRANAEWHSVIDLTLSKCNVELRCASLKNPRAQDLTTRPWCGRSLSGYTSLEVSLGWGLKEFNSMEEKEMRTKEAEQMWKGAAARGEAGQPSAVGLEEEV